MAYFNYEDQISLQRINLVVFKTVKLSLPFARVTSIDQVQSNRKRTISLVNKLQNLTLGKSWSSDEEEEPQNKTTRTPKKKRRRKS
jgi:hypothetical protein